MTEQEIQRLKQMLSSENENDVNLAGQLIVNNWEESGVIEIMYTLMANFTHLQIRNILDQKYVKQSHPLESWRMTFLDFGQKDITRCGELKLELEND